MFSAKSISGARTVAIVIGCLLGLLLSASIASPQSVPKAICGPGDHTESGLQGQTTTQERFSGDSERAFNCNLELVGEFRGEGAYSQDGPAYAGDCAYYGTDNNTPLQKHHGVTVIDASDPTHPVPSANLDDTAAALTPHETVQTNERRHLLAVGESGGPDFAVYDISDCRHPFLKADSHLPGSHGHMGAFAPDGLTYYLTQNDNFGGNGGYLYIVDLTDPSNPVELPPWHFHVDGQPHGLELNPEGFVPGVTEGTRVYAGQAGNAPPAFAKGPDGLVIEDVSDYQFRRPNPQIRIISKLFWTDQGIAEPMVPVKINGHPYIISSDEGGGAAGPGGLAAACARTGSLFGFPQIIDVSDETNPQIIAKLRLEVSDPANCLQVANNTPPDPPGSAPGTNLPAASGTTNYSEERCVPDNPNDARMMACSFQNAGLRVFDIRDPLNAKEIAYWKPGAVRTEVRPSSGSWSSGVDRTVDKIAGWTRWVFPDNNNGQVQLWTVSDGNGFQVLRFTDHFIARNRDLFVYSSQ
jgi:hypothetical protein